jgi:DNA-binding XRE family transcriptional regulator
MVEKPDLPTQREMANALDVSQRTISRNIKKLKMKLMKKPKSYFLTPATILKRYKRSWPLCLRLCKDLWKDSSQVIKHGFISQILEERETCNISVDLESDLMLKWLILKVLWFS